MVRCLLLILALLAGPSFANIFGEDNRVQKDSDDPEFPVLKAVGIVYSEDANGSGRGWIVKDAQNTGYYAVTNYHVALPSGYGEDGKPLKTLTGAARKAAFKREFTFAVGAKIKRPSRFQFWTQ